MVARGITVVGGPPHRPHERELTARLLERASGTRVALAEGEDERVAKAARVLQLHGIDPLLLRPDGLPRGVSRRHLARDFAERVHGQTSVSEAERLADDPCYAAGMLLRVGAVNAAVAGATRPTQDVLRAAIRTVGLAEGSSLVSSSFLMLLPDGRLLGYGDCAVIPLPDAEQLAQIAVATADTYEKLTGVSATVAMLSFSTKSSADHQSVRKVQEATRLARKLAPTLEIDGELQFDAAWVSEVGARKAPGSPVPGQANVFVFPNLDSGNIAYKLSERLGGAVAYGPLLQGLAQPMHDLSRGCSTSDIVAVTAIAGAQARS